MTHFSLVDSNKQKSFVIVTLFMLFTASVASVFAYSLGYGLDRVGVAFLFSGISGFLSYWYSDQIILTLSGARQATREEFFDYFTVTENLSRAASLPFPKLYVIEDTAMNAFATGRDPEHAVVCATTGLLSRLNRAEIEAVVAHELAHVKNFDIRLQSVVSVLVGLIALMADFFLRISAHGGGRKKDDSSQLQAIFFVIGIVLALISPLIAQLIQLSISRRREYLADATGVSFTKNPQGLVKALQKISTDVEPLEAANKATAHLYFSDPLKNLHGGVGWFSSLFQTHPPIEDRIAALKSIA